RRELLDILHDAKRAAANEQLGLVADVFEMRAARDRAAASDRFEKVVTSGSGDKAAADESAGSSRVSSEQKAEAVDHDDVGISRPGHGFRIACFEDRDGKAFRPGKLDDRPGALRMPAR